jgi:uroporphyrinogen-III decarboxylase
MNAVVMPLDHTLEIEALGSSIYWENGKPFIKEHFSLEEIPSFEEETWSSKGRITVFIEAAKHFAQVEGKNIPLFAVVTGPLTI